MKETLPLRADSIRLNAARDCSLKFNSKLLWNLGHYIKDWFLLMQLLYFAK